MARDVLVHRWWLGFKQSILDPIARVLRGVGSGMFARTPASPPCSCPFRLSPSGKTVDPEAPLRATFALKAGVWFRRGRLLIVSPALRPSWPPSGRNLYGAYWCQVLNVDAVSFLISHPRLLQPGFGSVHNDPRGTRHRAQTIAPHTCIRRIQRIQTMMRNTHRRRSSEAAGPFSTAA